MWQRRPKTVVQLEACIRQEWDNIPIPKLEQLVSSVPRRLQTVIKRKGMPHSGKHGLVPNFFRCLMPWNLKSNYFSLKMIHFLSLNIWYVIYVVFWIKYWNLKLPHHCILFWFTICTVSQLFWNRVCICQYLMTNLIDSISPWGKVVQNEEIYHMIWRSSVCVNIWTCSTIWGHFLYKYCVFWQLFLLLL